MGQRDLPLGSGTKHAAAFCRLGFERKPREGKGSHIIVEKDGQRLSIPAHSEVKRPLIAELLKQASISVADYVAAYNGKRR